MEKREMFYRFSLLVLLGLSFVMVSCNPDESTGTSGGNPATIYVQNTAYTNDGTIVLFTNPAVKKIAELFLIPSAIAAPVNDFKFCITKLKVVASEGAVAGVSQEAILGLVDVSDPNVQTPWDAIVLEEGSSISEIHFEVHHDPQNCAGANYSVSYQGNLLTADMEFKFKFPVPVIANHGDTFQVGLSNIAKAMEDALLAGQFNDQQINTYLQAAQLDPAQEL